MKKIIFATGNADKMKEIRKILADLDAEVVSMKEAGIQADIVEDGKTFEENAVIKATAISKLTSDGEIVLADDSGLEIDYLNKEISKYIVHLMTTEMTIQDSQKLNAYYRIIGDLERIGDHAINFVDYLHNMSEWDIKFSQSAIESLEKMKALCEETLEGISKENINGRKHVLEVAAKNEQRIDDMQESLLKGQIERMQSGKCSAEAGVILSEMLTDFERIGDHALNIAEKYQEMQM